MKPIPCSGKAEAHIPTDIISPATPLWKLKIRLKSNSHYTCQLCSSTEFIQVHHKIPGDDNSLIVLCADCHSNQHPNIPKNLFFNKIHQPYWLNKSASTLSKELGVHPRTIIRIAKRSNIPTGYLSLESENLIISSISVLYKPHEFCQTCNCSIVCYNSESRRRGLCELRKQIYKKIREERQKKKEQLIMPEYTTIQVTKETADKLRQASKGAPYEESIKLLLGKNQIYTFPFSKSIAASHSDIIERRVPFNGRLTEAIFNCPPGPRHLVEMRLLVISGGNKKLVIPEIENTYLILDNVNPHILLNYEVKAGEILRMEWYNYDSVNAHNIPVIVSMEY